MSLFRRRRPPPRDSPYDGLRAMVLGADPDSAGIPRRGRVWGALMEQTYEPGRSMTLVCLGDGTTSLYTSTGGGVIGGGAHEAVAAATLRFVGVVEEWLAAFERDPDDGLPPPGGVVLRALTYDGRLRVAAPEAELADGRHPVAPVFHAAHEVISELRMAGERRPDGH